MVEFLAVTKLAWRLSIWCNHVGDRPCRPTGRQGTQRSSQGRLRVRLEVTALEENAHRAAGSGRSW